MPEMSPVKRHRCWRGSRKSTSKSSCHSATAPGGTSRRLGLSRRCSSVPKTVTLKYSKRRWGDSSKGLRGTRRRRRRDGRGAGGQAALPMPTAASPDTTCERKRPRQSALKGTITPYSLSLPDRRSSAKTRRNGVGVEKRARRWGTEGFQWPTRLGSPLAKPAGA